MKPAGTQYKQPVEGGRLGRELFGLFAIFCGLLLILSLASFDSRDPWLSHVVSGVPKVYNKAGLFGAYLGGLLFDLFGFAAWVAPGFFCLVGARRILGSASWAWWRWMGIVLLAVCISLAGAARDLHLVESVRGALPGAGNISSHGGGLLGHMLYEGMVGWMSTTGTLLVWIFIFLLAVQMLVGFSWIALLVGAAASFWRTCTTMAGDVAERKERAAPPLLPGTGNGQGAPARESAGSAGPPERDLIRVRPSDKNPAASDGNLVHPALIPSQPPQAPYSPLPGPIPASANAANGPSLDSPDDLPPWVRDFEEDRLALSPPARNGETRGRAKDAPLELLWDFQNDGRSHAPEAAAEYPAPSSGEQQRPRPADAPQNEDGPLADNGTPDGAASADAVIPIREAGRVELAAPASGPGLLQSAVSLVKKPLKIPLPSLDLLEPAPSSGGGTPREVLEAKGKSLMTCLTDFGIQGELVGITPGPVVTMFEVRPAPGVRVSRIANLSDDLALALKAVAVRIQAPVPGTDTVGIEIPNEVRETVCLKELLSSKMFQSSRSLLTLALGKDIAGNPAVADLAGMPHLLVAGATGAGKSVGINSIILSLIYKARPDEVKLLLVDPKRVEMAIYADLPHLVHPVVTEMQLAKNALEWAVTEMEQRYAAIAKASVRNIADYNAKLASWGNKRPEGMEDLEFMPYLVLIIDELADLMLVAAKEVETSIVRLAQLARAAGIHLILATQRPSVDVVTGLIKANFPCRISFQVTSKHDSRTILDTVGAEHLLGRGDMLFKPGGGKFQRLHGAFVSDKNVLAVTDYWRSKLKPEYSVDFSDWGTGDSGDGVFTGNGGEDMSADPIYPEAVAFVRQQGKASISLIQRRFRIGFNKAARLVEQMEQDGIIGPADGSKPRPVL